MELTLGLSRLTQENKNSNPTPLVDPSFAIKNDRGLREEIEIELKTVNGAPFTGSITIVEAKHGIYRDSLGFTDFKNFFLIWL